MQEILTVTQLTLAIKKQLESGFSQLSVQGEISNFKEQTSGHLYFTLKDAETQIAAVLFKGNTRGLMRMPKAGDQVIVTGELSLYAPRGSYQIIVRELKYAGVGELLLKLHELKLVLHQRGWFAAERKKPLPKFPKTIGVVTSPTGAVIQDILHVLNRRFPGFHLILNPVRVQGEGAALEIAQAIEQFNKHQLADVLIVGRGGGSLEDLWAFNEEIVAAAIFASKIPVISAVGHETDVCIADFVADRRAPTPSAAAEIALGERAQHLQHLEQTRMRLKQTLVSLVRIQRQRLERFTKQNILSSPYALLSKYLQLVDGARSDLETAFKRTLHQKKSLLLALHRQVATMQPGLQIEQRKKELARLTSHLRSINPRNLLTKGYCILFEENSKCAILSSQKLKSDQKLQICMHDGHVNATVNEVFQ